MANERPPSQQALLDRIDEYEEARDRLRRSPDDTDEAKYALDNAVSAWQRVLDAKRACQQDKTP